MESIHNSHILFPSKLQLFGRDEPMSRICRKIQPGYFPLSHNPAKVEKAFYTSNPKVVIIMARGSILKCIAQARSFSRPVTMVLTCYLIIFPSQQIINFLKNKK